MYALSLGERTASGYTIGSNGTLSPVPGSPFSLPGCCGFQYSVAIDPIHNFLFYLVGGNGFFGSGGLYITQVRPDGSITAPGTNIDPVSLAPLSLALDPSYKFVYTCNIEGKPEVVSFGYTGSPISQQSTLRPAAFPVQITASP